ncbi:MAG: permease-like cell division protein FtsX [Cyclobacteriaceae bacterium]|nr:permease-like cell division protein FtsX [Cyclobacteriaceae bacterium]
MAKGKKKNLGSYPSVSVIGSMFLALTVLGLFGMLIILSKNISKAIQDNMQIQVFLDKEISESQRQRIEKTISDMDFVLKKDNTPVIEFISKEDAAESFIEESGEDFLEFLGDNPLRDSYLINIDFSSTENLDLEKESEKIGQINGVFEVSYVGNMINSVNKNLTRIGLFLMGFAIILVILVIILINNTIKLALFSQRFLIRSMQLVGAKSSFIRGPFLKKSFQHGMLAGILASSFLYFLYYYGTTQVEGLKELTELYQTNSFIVLFCGLLLTGGLVGFSGTYLAISKYMKMSLDELY